MQNPANYTGTLRNHMVEAPPCIQECTGIRIFGRLLKSIMFSTDVAIIANTNADAIIAVYPFTPQPRIVSAVMSAADMPVFFGVGGGFTSGTRSVNQALAAENMGAIGVVLNAPVPPEVLQQIKDAVDIPVVSTVVSAEQNTESRIAAGVDILNVAASAQTPAVVARLRERHPDFPIMATGGPTEDTIRATIAAGANAITFTPPDTGVLLAEIMRGHRERFKHGD
ncbi:MAG: hydrolase [Oscillospiraceae bacterium]|nr:hydrolase [Oscillospiraceae bacterium]